MHRLNRGITGSWSLVALNTYLTISIAGTTLLMIDPGAANTQGPQLGSFSLSLGQPGDAKRDARCSA